MSMAALPVIENLDVIEHIAVCFLAIAIDAASHALLL